MINLGYCEFVKPSLNILLVCYTECSKQGTVESIPVHIIPKSYRQREGLITGVNGRIMQYFISVDAKTRGE